MILLDNMVVCGTEDLDEVQQLWEDMISANYNLKRYYYSDQFIVDIFKECDDFCVK